MADIFLFKSGNGHRWERDRTPVSRETVTNFIVPLITDFLSFYVLDKRPFKISALLMKVDLFVLGDGFALLPLMLNQVVEVEGLLDSKTFMDHRIDCVRFASRKRVLRSTAAMKDGQALLVEIC
jgi:hypothetical protein